MGEFDAAVLDLDGTTVASSEHALPSERVIKAVKAAQEYIFVTVATGRPYAYAATVIDALGLEGLGVFNGGAEIVDMSTGNAVQRYLLSKNDMRELAGLALPFGYDVYKDDDKYSVPITSPDEIEADDVKMFIEAVKNSDAVKLLQELEAVENASAHLTSSWAEGDVIDIHITHREATKKHGVERLLSMLELDKARVMGIGDSYNDIPMLESVGFKVVLASGPKEVQAVANYVAPSFEDDGVADALERFILQKS